MTADFVGARWWRFDFHTRTPASPDYGKGPEPKTRKAQKERTPREWLLDFMRAEIDCVAITDRNTGDWVDKLKDAYSSLASTRPADFRPLFLFPGVEISVNGGIHLLAILDPAKGTSDVASLLRAVEFPADRHGASDACTSMSPREVAREIHASGGLAIPAHADSGSGLFDRVEGATLKAILEDGRLSAIELADPRYSLPRIYRDSRPDLPSVLGTDRHHSSGTADANCPGSRFTWIKMGRPSFEGLRLALLDGAPLSVHRSDAGIGDPNREPGLWIQSVEVADAHQMGHGDPATARFSPWLSTIIGGRGTGKSTLIEMTRIGMRRKDDISASLRNDLDRFDSVSDPRTGLGAMKDTTEVRINLCKDGASFRVRWRHDGEGSVIEEMADDESWKTGLGVVASRFPVRILSQKEVYALANDPAALLRLVDDAEPVRRGQWAETIETSEAEFISLRSQARALESRIAERQRLEGELADVGRQIALFEDGGNKGLLRQYQSFARQERVLTDRAREMEQNVATIRRAVDEVEPSDYPNDFREDGDALDLMRKATAQQAAAASVLRQQATALDDFRAAWITGVGDSEWDANRKSTARSYDRLIARLRDEGVEDPGAYGSLIQRQAVIRQQLNGTDALVRDKEELEDRARAVFGRIENCRRGWTDARRDFVASVLADNEYVKIEVVPFGVSAVAAEESFREAIARPDGGLEAGILTEDGTQGLLARLFSDLPSGGKTRAQTFDTKVRDLKEALVRAHRQEDVPGTSEGFRKHIERLTPEQMDRVRLWWPEDGLRVQYRRSTTGKFVALSQGSPGQKSAAILAFLLSYGDQPIVLDQPEDDLDNHLIYGLVVRQIRENKRRRQVIIATHNPNLVVNGDAETVISMDHRDGECMVVPEATGSLQDPRVRDEVCRVMEGGRRAFESRYRRLKVGVDDA